MTDQEIFEHDELRARIIEIEADLDSLIYVNAEILKMMGFSIMDVLKKDGINKTKVAKALKNMLMTIAVEEEGIKALIAHFAEEAMTVGTKYYKRAEQLQAERNKKG